MQFQKKATNKRVNRDTKDKTITNKQFESAKVLSSIHDREAGTIT